MLLTSELPEKSDWLSADTISEFICDGVVILQVLVLGEEMNRTIQIRKMRYAKIDGGIKSYQIEKNGIVLA